jgi:DASS family divalent anion:Na+ symporter
MLLLLPHHAAFLPVVAVLISMSLGLQSLGVIDTFSGWAGTQLDALALPWPALFAALHLTFFGAHYLFASQTAHVGALYAAFCSLMISSGESHVYM